MLLYGEPRVRTAQEERAVIMPLWCAPDAADLVRHVRWVGGCTKNDRHEQWLPRRQVPAVMINVGANKGWEIAAFLEHSAPSRAVSAARWLGAIRRYANVTHSGYLAWNAAGACKTKSRPHGQPRVGRTGHRGTHATTQEAIVHAFELTAATSHLLSWVVNDTGVSDLVRVHNQPVANTSEPMSSLVLKAGEERNRICLKPTCGKGKRFAGNVSRVNSTSLDAFMVREGLHRVDQLIIDTEGWDALVLEGATATLRAHRIGLLEFEYSSYGFWNKGFMAKKNRGERRDLGQTLRWLQDSGYQCFFRTADGVLPISAPCWSEPFEIRRWSNVICAHEPSTLAALERSARQAYDARLARSTVTATPPVSAVH